jgi:predicted neutral ceramidase superfamily lipid hydrolase
MELKSLLVITAVLGLLLGLGFFFIPAEVMSTFGVSASEAHQHTARNFGSALIALAVISWVSRDAVDSKARRAIILGLFTYFIFSSISIISFQLQGNANVYGWFIIVLQVLLVLAFGYYIFVNRSPVDR